MDQKNNAGNRKSRKFRSISRSLILCNAKNSDDGSSPDEKCPDSLEISTSWGQEDFDCCPRTQLPCTSEAGDSPPDPPRVVTSILQSKAAANENCNNTRRKFLTKETPTCKERPLEIQNGFLHGKAACQRTRSNSTSKLQRNNLPFWAGDVEGPAPRRAAPLRDRLPHALHASRKSLSQQLDCPAGRAPVSAAGATSKTHSTIPSRALWMTVADTVLPGPISPSGPARDHGHSAPSAFHPQHLLCEEQERLRASKTPISPGSPSHCPAGFVVCDEILELNGESMHGLTHYDALQKFKQAKKGLLTLTVRTSFSTPHSASSCQSPLWCQSLSSSTCITKENSSFSSENAAFSLNPTKPNDRVIMEVTLNKEPGVGLGIGLCSIPYFQCISGIFIHTLSPGSVAHMDGRLRCGDEILEINETSVQNTTLNEVYAVLSHCDPGAVQIIISRHPEPQ
ncbi:IL16 protein, partial [Aleadryas rufinucha]|nr:IL16 protein [Aleadryas rufinucha]